MVINLGENNKKVHERIVDHRSGVSLEEHSDFLSI